ncbi:hypothetical protein ACFQL4_00015 [Halosimplex aquaticum]
MRGSVLETNGLFERERLETATAGRSDWSNSTPTDAGEALFGPIETDE